jgi:hypothetical protein
MMLYKYINKKMKPKLRAKITDCVLNCQARLFHAIKRGLDEDPGLVCVLLKKRYSGVFYFCSNCNANCGDWFA